jgi:alpha-tubulin suppressor-like RCC1 family protein
VKCWGSAAALATTLSTLGEVSVAVGADHACATNAGFGLACWGQNGSGQAAPPAPPAFVQIGAGGAFGCAATGSNLFTPSEAFAFDCWGANGSGQATENTNARLAPALGLNHACALTASGTAVCWGDNSFNQGTHPPATTFTALAAGTRHTCGITSTGTLGCWGSPLNGRTTPPADVREARRGPTTPARFARTAPYCVA